MISMLVTEQCITVTTAAVWLVVRLHTVTETDGLTPCVLPVARNSSIHTQHSDDLVKRRRRDTVGCVFDWWLKRGDPRSERDTFLFLHWWLRGAGVRFSFDDVVLF